MNTRIPILAFAAATALTAALCGASAAHDRSEAFVTKFRQAQQINSKDEMAKLLRQYQVEAVPYIIERCETLPEISNAQQNARLEEDMAYLRSAWRDAFKSGFVERVYEYYSLVDQSSWKERQRLKVAYLKVLDRHLKNEELKNGPESELLSQECKQLALGFEQVGDFFHVARCWNLVGLNCDEYLRGSDGDLYRAAEAFGKTIEFCDRIELNDGWYQQTAQRYRSLEANGYTGAPPDPNAPPPDAPVEAPGIPAVVAQMSFEAIPKLETFERPSYVVDDVYQIWPSVYMQERGSSGKFFTLGDRPLLLRVGSSELAIDFDGDGQGDQKVPAKGNRTLVDLPLGEGEEARRWAFLTEVGVQNDTYQGLSYNLSNSDEAFNLFIVGAGSLVGTLGEVPVRVIDDNLDGIYGSGSKGWNWIGLVKDELEPDVDSIVIGSSKRARPWSEFQNVEGQWYKMASVKAGLEIQATPVEVETGRLKLDYKGTRPEFLVVRGKGSLEASFFDLEQNGAAGVEVPVGQYELSFGIVRKGKKAQTVKALILPGKNTPTWTVAAGETTAVSMGAPFAFTFDYQAADETLTVKGESVVIVGSASERYRRLWNCVPRPEVSYRKAGSRRGSKPKPDEMDIVLDIYEQDEKGESRWTSASTFAPVDTVFEIKSRPGEQIEVQLFEKKNKLFKSIESDWK
jgi:hypothetical protein